MSLGEPAGRSRGNPVRDEDVKRRTVEQRIDAGPHPEDERESFELQRSRALYIGCICVLVGSALLLIVALLPI